MVVLAGYGVGVFWDGLISPVVAVIDQNICVCYLDLLRYNGVG